MICVVYKVYYMRLLKSYVFCSRLTGDICGLLSILFAIIEELLVLFQIDCGPGISLTLCCFVVYSTRQFVVCLSMCHFVLVFFSPFSIAITSLGQERANLSAFRTFIRFVLV